MSEQPMDGRCGKKRTSGDGYCEKWPIDGGTTCYKHGSGNSRAKAAAKRNIAEQKAAAELARMGIPIPVDAIDALIGQVWEASGNVAYLRERVGNLPDITDEVYVEGGHHTVIHVIVKLYGEWCDRLARMSKLALDAGVAERQVTIAERQGELLAQVLRGVLEDLGVSDDPRVPEIVGRRLRAVTA